MSNLAVIENKSISFNSEQIDLIKKTIAKDATDNELKLFLSQCQRTGLDPITKQIYFIKDKQGKVTIVTSIDGYRLIAERSNKYQGQTKPEWCGDDGVWKEVWLSSSTPAAARIGVYKDGFKEPVYGVAVFAEYAQKGYNGKLPYMWEKMPAHMISKVCEALAFRKAFPNELSGIITQDEITVEVEAHEMRQATEIATVKQLTEKEIYKFESGRFQGKKFSEVDPAAFMTFLADCEAVEKKTPNLQQLIDRMKQYIDEMNKAASAAIDERLG